MYYILTLQVFAWLFAVFHKESENPNFGCKNESGWRMMILGYDNTHIKYKICIIL